MNAETAGRSGKAAGQYTNVSPTGIPTVLQTDWKPSYIACRAFNQDPPKIPVFEQGTGKVEDLPEGQMSLFDFME